jgi:hypothetical protein
MDRSAIRLASKLLLKAESTDSEHESAALALRTYSLLATTLNGFVEDDRSASRRHDRRQLGDRRAARRGQRAAARPAAGAPGGASASGGPPGAGQPSGGPPGAGQPSGPKAGRGGNESPRASGEPASATAHEARASCPGHGSPAAQAAAYGRFGGAADHPPLVDCSM